MPYRRKILLMGRSGVGKTSMRSIVFANYIARDTNRIGPTIEVEHAHVRFLRNLIIHLWDCGGQDNYMQNYLVSQKEQIFKNVQVLIYVFDIESKDMQNDIQYFQCCLEALFMYSPYAEVFCLVHKIDLVEENRRSSMFADKEAEILRYSQLVPNPNHATIQVFKSSIWDETVYQAWSAIVFKIIPNMNVMQEKLIHFTEAIEADEVLLFERATFLVISHAQCREYKDKHRFEKISNIIKHFKLSCSRLCTQFESIHIENKNFTAYIDAFTSSTYIMAIFPNINFPAATMLNIKNAAKFFERLEAVKGAL